MKLHEEALKLVEDQVRVRQFVHVAAVAIIIHAMEEVLLAGQMVRM